MSHRKWWSKQKYKVQQQKEQVILAVILTIIWLIAGVILATYWKRFI